MGYAQNRLTFNASKINGLLHILVYYVSEY